METESTALVSASVYIKRLSFQGGATLDLQDNSIVVLVGPNNSGKSLSLKEIVLLAEGGRSSGQTKSVHSIELQRVGDINLLERTIEPFRNRQDNRVYLSGDQYTNASSRDIKNAWDESSSGLGSLTKLFVEHLTTEKRLADSNPVDTFDTAKHRYGVHPIHSLYMDYERELKISSIFMQYFNVDLIIHKSPSRSIPLYVGSRPIFEGAETSSTRSYLDKN